MENCTPTEIPMPVETGNNDINEPLGENEFSSYGSIVGSLLYLAFKSRPNIAVAASTLRAFVS